MRPAGEGEAQPVTSFSGQPEGLPETVLFTKFAVTTGSLVIPIETRSGNIYILGNLR
jgi:hypothetical protein